jgi:hypothetical protein
VIWGGLLGQAAIVLGWAVLRFADGRLGAFLKESGAGEKALAQPQSQSGADLRLYFATC